MNWNMDGHVNNVFKILKIISVLLNKNIVIIYLFKQVIGAYFFYFDGYQINDNNAI